MDNTNKNVDTMLRSAPSKAPVALGALYAAAGMLWCILPGLFEKAVPEMYMGYIRALSAIALLLLFRLRFRALFRGCLRPMRSEDKAVVYVCLIYLAFEVVINLPGYMEKGFDLPGVRETGNALAAAIGEEAAFRVLPIAVMMYTYRGQHRYMPALLFSSAVFGIMHMGSSFSGTEAGLAAFRSLYAGVSGLLLGALYLHCGNIIPSMALHFLHDLIFSPEAGGALSLSLVFKTALMSAFSLLLTWLLLRSSGDKISSVWNERWGSTSYYNNKKQAGS